MNGKQPDIDRDLYNYIAWHIYGNHPSREMWNDLWWLLANAKFVQLSLPAPFN